MPPVTLAVIGAGSRGRHAYGRWALEHPDQARVVAVAEPDPARRAALAAEHGIGPDGCFDDWRRLLDAPLSVADALVVATPDRDHAGPAAAALERGYDLLLEKPIAATPDEVAAVAAAAARSSGSATVAHVLRYTPFFRTLKRLVAGGAIGRLVAIDHLENIGHWHFAHSYVRGVWRRESEAAPMILAKACHDLDLLRWFAGARCVSVASVGGLAHFHYGNAPPGAPARCTDGCPVADECPFYAPRFYLERLAGVTGPPISALSLDPSPAAVERALREGPYGRCVYRCDNDVADHQQVLLGFANSVTASLTVSAFTADNTRTVKLMGTRGELRGRLDTGEIELRRFGTPSAAEIAAARSAVGEWERDAAGRAALAADPVERFDVRGPAGDPTGAVAGLRGYGGHGGGDDALMRDWIGHLRAWRDGGAGRTRERPSEAGELTSIAEAVESHLIAFAAERSRRDGSTVRL